MKLSAQLRQEEQAPRPGVTSPVVQLFFNPTSGSASARRVRSLVAAFERQGAAVLETPSCENTPEIHPQATHICVSGGDGTVRHVAAELARGGYELPVAIYPAGTVNLLAREARLPSDPDSFAKMLLSGDSCRPHCPVRMGETMFFACASIGPDSVAVADCSATLKRRIGRLAYAVSFLRLLWRWPRQSLCLTAPDGPIECEAAYIAKGRYYAGPWSFAPQARTDDGLLHVVALKRARRRDFLRFAIAILTGRDVAEGRGVTRFTCTQMSIDCDPQTAIQADGDIVAHGPVQLSIHPFAPCFR